MPKIELTTGNWITIAVFVIGIISAWAKIQVHISDEAIHLTEEQRNNLIKFKTIVDEKLPIIDENKNFLIELDKSFALFDKDFFYLGKKFEYLEKKQARNYVELRERDER